MGTILVVDDLEINFDFLEQLAGSKFDLAWAPNGFCALELIRRDDYEAIFMDIVMPEMDGYETAAAIRQLEMESNKIPIPIVGLTAHQEAYDRDKCLNSGFSAFITKLITQGQFLSIMHQVARNDFHPIGQSKM